jgi:pSer/pThr/pTyr-binding forkhead associated (FHA) protein
MSTALPAHYRVRRLDQADADGWLLARGRYRLGRAADADLRLAHVTVSRLHAEIEVLEGGGVVLTDLHSTNGTWLGARRVTRVALSGDFDLRVGALQLEFCALGA